MVKISDTGRLLCWALAACLWAAAAHAGPAADERQNAVRQFLVKQWVKGHIANASTYPLTAFDMAFADLNGDGSEEAIVRVTAPDFCGSGGCDLYVLEPAGSGFKMRGAISIAQPPIRILPSKTRGWSDLGIWVAGGGVIHGYEARLRFNGVTYPLNPSMAPRSKARSSLTLIARTPLH